MTDYLKKNRVNICLLLLIAGVVSMPLMKVTVVTELTDKLLLVLVNIGTAAVAFVCFNRMFGRNAIGIIGSMLYTWCPYRCSDMYINFNMGVVVAWTFLPIVLLGLVQLYTISVEERQYKGIWVILTLGFSLLAASSIPFFCVAVGAALVMFLIMGKRSLQKQTLVSVGVTILATLLASAWVLVPLMLRMRDVNVVGSMIPGNFRMGGMYLVQYLSLFPSTGASLNFLEKGLRDAQEMGVGAAVVLLVFLYIWSLFVKKFSDDFGRKILWFVLVLMILSSNLFPWDLLQNKNMLFSIVLALLQSPAKWGVVACTGLIWIACRMLQKLSESDNVKLYQTILVVTAAISFGTNQLFNWGL